jgi:hypothetical protein
VQVRPVLELLVLVQALLKLLGQLLVVLWRLTFLPLPHQIHFE